MYYMKSTNKVIVGMSGGVDSAVAAAYLKKNGYEVEGAYLQMQQYDSGWEDACRIARHLDIPIQKYDLSESFRDIVIADFIECYTHGRTPNPCAICNPLVKFAGLKRIADERGARWIATGHYADTVEQDGRWYLCRKPTQAKDQSYALYRLGQDIISSLKLPIGDFESKEAVRAFAEAEGIPVANKPDSQETCFIEPPLSPAEYIEQVSGQAAPEGDFVTSDGKLLGRHKGITHYTVGQRRGLGISAPNRIFVLKIDPETNQVVLGEDEELWVTEVPLTDIFLNVDVAVGESIQVTAKIRYNDTDTPASFTRLSETEGLLSFLSPKRAAAAGQSAVLYDGTKVLGGGIIK